MLPCAPNLTKPVETFRRRRFAQDEKKPNLADLHLALLSNDSSNKRLNIRKHDLPKRCPTQEADHKSRALSEGRFKLRIPAIFQDAKRKPLVDNLRYKQDHIKINRPPELLSSSSSYRRRSQFKKGVVSERSFCDFTTASLSTDHDLGSTRCHELICYKVEPINIIDQGFSFDSTEHESSNSRIRGQSLDSVSSRRTSYRRKVDHKVFEAGYSIDCSHIPIQEEFDEGSSQKGDEAEKSMLNEILNGERCDQHLLKDTRLTRSRINNAASIMDYEKEALKIDQEVANFIKLGIVRKQLLLKKHQELPESMIASEIIKMKAIIERMLAPII